MKVVSGILRALSWIVYVVIIASLVIAAPILFGNRPVIILSGSMEPAYPVGSIIYYKPAEFSSIEAGDAITFQIGEGSLATHRVVSVNTEEQSFITKGDNNPTEDSQPVTYDRVEGKASDFAVPYAGYFTQYVQNWWAIAITGVILLLDMLLGGKKKKKEPAAEEKSKEEFFAETKPKKKSSGDISAEEFFKDL